MDCLMGFSDGEDEDLDSGLKCCIAENSELDLIATLLEDSSGKGDCLPHKMKQSKMPACRKEDEESLLQSRVNKMEKELHELRQKVKDQDALQQGTHSKRSITSSVVKEKASGPPARVESACSMGGRNLASQLITRRQDDKQAGIVTEKYSGFRMKNPLVSSEQMKLRMEGREMIKIKSLSSKKNVVATTDDWVTIGVLVDKLSPRDTVNGKKYSIWKLSDLSSLSAVISLFVFGTAFQTHWKTSLGTIVAILNPRSMSDAQKGANKQNAAFSIDNFKKLMVMGISQDYTTCKGTTKSRKRCTNFANISDGGYCDYHVCRAYDASRSRRMECQSGYGPNATKGTLKERLFRGTKTELYHYGGQTFTAGPKPLKKEAQSRLFTPRSSEIFKKMLQSQSAGARMVTQHMKGKDTQKDPAAVGLKVAEEKSPSELLREHQSSMPLIGRGSLPGHHMDLFSPPPSLAKRKAINLIKKKGSTSNDASAEKVIQKVQESRFNFEEEAPSAPKKVKRNSNEIDQLINAKSSHDWVNEEAETARKEEYFDRLEKKESIDTKKSCVTELRITVVCCKKCNYTAESPGKLCIRENHTLSRFKALKRGFVCKGCSEKRVTYDSRWPVDSCKKCGGTSYDQASIYRERKGPDLPTEQLLLRGIEEKFMH